MLLCDEVVSQPGKQTLDLSGVRSTIVAASFPYVHPQLCVYLELSGHRGVMPTSIVCVHADSNRGIIRSKQLEVPFTSPLAVVRVIFRIRNCPFKSPGLYLVECWAFG